MMQRADVLAAMADRNLFGMRAAYAELIAKAIRCHHEPQRVISDPLAAEINEIERACRPRRPLARGTIGQIPVLHNKLPFASGSGSSPSTVGA